MKGRRRIIATGRATAVAARTPAAATFADTLRARYHRAGRVGSATTGGLAPRPAAVGALIWLNLAALTRRWRRPAALSASNVSIGGTAAGVMAAPVTATAPVVERHHHDVRTIVERLVERLVSPAASVTTRPEGRATGGGVTRATTLLPRSGATARGGQGQGQGQMEERFAGRNTEEHGHALAPVAPSTTLARPRAVAAAAVVASRLGTGTRANARATLVMRGSAAAAHRTAPRYIPPATTAAPVAGLSKTPSATSATRSATALPSSIGEVPFSPPGSLPVVVTARAEGPTQIVHAPDASAGSLRLPPRRQAGLLLRPAPIIEARMQARTAGVASLPRPRPPRFITPSPRAPADAARGWGVPAGADDGRFPLAPRPPVSSTTGPEAPAPSLPPATMPLAPRLSPRRPTVDALPFLRRSDKTVDLRQIQETVTRRIEETLHRRVVESVESVVARQLARQLAPDSALARNLGDRITGGLYESLVLEKERLGWG
ncbi:MAG: hypothetical protein ABUR63_01610 [Verrucomicrobiota bacterium]